MGVVSAGHVTGTRGSGIVSSVCHLDCCSNLK